MNFKRIPKPGEPKELFDEPEEESPLLKAARQLAWKEDDSK
jgi:hypothetical protein